MAQLPSPMEVLDLKDGESLEFTVERWEKGETTIHPRHLSAPIVVPALRVHVRQADKPMFPHYYDLTAKGLQAQLEPFLEAGGGQGRRVRITKHGIQPKARFTLEVLPA